MPQLLQTFLSFFPMIRDQDGYNRLSEEIAQFCMWPYLWEYIPLRKEQHDLLQNARISTARRAQKYHQEMLSKENRVKEHPKALYDRLIQKILDKWWKFACHDWFCDIDSERYIPEVMAWIEEKYEKYPPTEAEEKIQARWPTQEFPRQVYAYNVFHDSEMGRDLYYRVRNMIATDRRNRFLPIPKDYDQDDESIQVLVKIQRFLRQEGFPVIPLDELCTIRDRTIQDVGTRFKDSTHAQLFLRKMKKYEKKHADYVAKRQADEDYDERLRQERCYEDDPMPGDW